MKKVTYILKKNWTIVAGALTGATGGFLYWYFIGCTTGTCPIKSSPTLMILYGTIVGIFIFRLFKKEE